MQRVSVKMLGVMGILTACGTAFAGLATPLTTVRVASGLTRPVFVTHAPGDVDRLFIVEQAGVIRILDLTTNTLLGASFLNIDALVGGGNSGNDERGLLGLAFHPDYDTNGFFYLNYTNNASDTVIARYSVSANPDIADSGSAQIVMTIDQPFTNHNGGWIAFSPNDGFLYIGTGDGGSGCDPGQRAQDITNQLLGKMLRIDVDVPGAGYNIPADNPFVGVTGDDEIWAYGLRNPWRCSFDRETADIYIGDVGQGAWEEVDFLSVSSTGGENFGWDCMEGNHCSSESGCGAGACTCAGAGLERVIHEYDHPTGFSITGGYVYRGCAIGDLQGTYFFADFVTERIWSFTYNGVATTNFQERTAELAPGGGLTIDTISSFGEDALGEIYIIDRAATGTGELFKIIPDTAGPVIDCNTNSLEDACDILAGTSSDANTNGIPDECEFTACAATAARSCNLHGATTLCLDILANDIEPRQSGATSIEIDVDAGTASSASVTCVTSGAYGGVASVSQVGSTVTVGLSPALPDGDACTITLDCGASVCVRGLAGDIDRNGIVSTGDASIIKPHFGESATVAGAEFDFDQNDIVSTGDASIVKPLFGNAATACP